MSRPLARTSGCPGRRWWLRLPGSTFDLQIERATPSVVIAVPRGHVGHDVAPRFRDAVAASLDAGATTVVFDLSETSFIDATALGVIVSPHAAWGRTPSCWSCPSTACGASFVTAVSTACCASARRGTRRCAAFPA
jgi:hypothetical protein